MQSIHIDSVHSILSWQSCNIDWIQDLSEPEDHRFREDHRYWVQDMVVVSFALVLSVRCFHCRFEEIARITRHLWMGWMLSSALFLPSPALVSRKYHQGSTRRILLQQQSAPSFEHLVSCVRSLLLYVMNVKHISIHAGSLHPHVCNSVYIM